MFNVMSVYKGVDGTNILQMRVLLRMKKKWQIVHAKCQTKCCRHTKCGESY